MDYEALAQKYERLANDNDAEAVELSQATGDARLDEMNAKMADAERALSKQYRLVAQYCRQKKPS